ncbi:MAG: HAD hydrolase-like protein, partial [Actinomycetota bacterium]|nr:HAD hydrolase-like protein [Actinomycetota bacterium]
MIEAVLFDIDGTLITTGGAGAVAWRYAFEEMYGVAADIDEFTHAGMTDPEVGRLTFVGALGRKPQRREFAKVMARRQHHLADAVAESQGYRVLDGVEDLLLRLVEDGLLLGLTTGNIEAAAHIKLSRANLNRFFSFGGYGSDSTKRVELTRKAIERAELVSGGTLEPAECIAV